jgi:hypothetical protein
MTEALLRLIQAVEVIISEINNLRARVEELEKIKMMDMTGRWLTKNKTLVAVHVNPDATEGDRVERWIGHTIPEDSRAKLGICWNENGEAVWIVAPTVVVKGDIKEWDLMERVTGKDRVENSIKMEGCKECEG